LELLGETTKLNGTDMKLHAAHAYLAADPDFPARMSVASENVRFL
jgi:hypothetical protein